MPPTLLCWSLLLLLESLPIPSREAPLPVAPLLCGLGAKKQKKKEEEKKI